MMRLFFLALVVVAGWYGYNHYPQLLDRRQGHQVVVVNRTGMTLERVRVSVGGTTYVREEIGDGQEASWEFKVASTSEFHLVWQYREIVGEHQWRGGSVPPGPMTQRHKLIVDADHAITYQPENR
jgi:hypothetical protein